MEQTMGKWSSLDYLLLTRTPIIYRPDEDIEMNVCETKLLYINVHHQSKPTDDIYDVGQPQGVYEFM